MTTQHDSVAVILAVRRYLYEFLQHLFGNEPTAELLDAATSEHTRDTLELFLDEDDSLRSYLDMLAELTRAGTIDDAATLDKLKSEYTRLLIGPHELPAPPWESVYLSKERTLFQENTLQVRRTYLQYQFLPVNYPHEADDHLAIELDFMVHLAKLTQEQFEQRNTESTLKLLTDQKVFLEHHLLLWIDDFAEDIQNSKTRHFYPQTAMLTSRILKVDSGILDELISVC